MTARLWTRNLKHSVVEALSQAPRSRRRRSKGRHWRRHRVWKTLTSLNISLCHQWSCIAPCSPKTPSKMLSPTINANKPNNSHKTLNQRKKIFLYITTLDPVNKKKKKGNGRAEEKQGKSARFVIIDFNSILNNLPILFIYLFIYLYFFLLIYLLIYWFSFLRSVNKRIEKRAKQTLL